MKKSEIKIGDHIIFNNGKEFISMGKSWNNATGWCNPSSWNEDLSYFNREYRQEWDIKKVFRPDHQHAYSKSIAENAEDFKLVYEKAPDNIEESDIIEAVADIKTEIALVVYALNSLAIKLEKLYDQSTKI